MKEILYAVFSVLAVLLLFAVPLTFYFSKTVLPAALDSLLKLKVSPAFSGGRYGRNCSIPRGTTQTAMLTPPEGTAGLYAVLFPVEIGKNAGDPGPDLKELEQGAKNVCEDESAAAWRDALEALETAEGEEKAALLFRLERYGEAEELIDSLHAEKDETPVLLAYQGSLAALRVGETQNPAEAMRLVNEAFFLFEKSEALCVNDDERLFLFINRGSVSQAVPESVFQKSLPGAHDFLAAAEILLTKPGCAASAQSLLVNAAVCFERAGKTNEAEKALVRAGSLVPLRAQTAWELARCGIIF